MVRRVAHKELKFKAKPADKRRNGGASVSGRNSQVSRIYVILQLLEASPSGLTVNELKDKADARGHAASVRTIYRDLEALQSSGFPLSVGDTTEDTNAQRWVLQRLTRINEHFVLNSRELLALFLAKGALTPLKDSPFYADLDSIFQKIEDRIGKKGTQYLEEAGREMFFEPGPRWGLGVDPDVLETVRAACSERHVLKLMYASASRGEKRERRLGPHYIYFAKASLYLVAEDLESRTVKVFALPRVSTAEMLTEEYSGKIPDPESFFHSTFGIFVGQSAVSVKISFSSKISPYVSERQWHQSQSVVRKGDGSIVLQLEVALTPEFLQWVLGFGAEARVVEPKILKDMLRNAAEEVVRLYERKVA